jgi:hypothetical protein
LQHAADYIMELPEDVQQQQRWQIAVENLINAAETGNGWLMFARRRRGCCTIRPFTNWRWPCAPAFPPSSAPAPLAPPRRACR